MDLFRMVVVKIFAPTEAPTFLLTVKVRGTRWIAIISLCDLCSIVLSAVANVIKLFAAISYDFS